MLSAITPLAPACRSIAGDRRRIVGSCPYSPGALSAAGSLGHHDCLGLSAAFSQRQGPSGSDPCEFYNRAGLCKTVRQPFRHETTLSHKPSRDARLLAAMSAGGKFKSDCDATLRFQELRDEVGMPERWTHRGRNGPSSTRLLRWHIG